jgi:hypothetical protein
MNLDASCAFLPRPGHAVHFRRDDGIDFVNAGGHRNLTALASIDHADFWQRVTKR